MTLTWSHATWVINHILKSQQMIGDELNFYIFFSLTITYSHVRHHLVIDLMFKPDING